MFRIESNGTGESHQDWPAAAFPAYLQGSDGEFCKKWESAFEIDDKETMPREYITRKGRLIWETIR